MLDIEKKTDSPIFSVNGLRVLYALESYPHLTQTYILVEIEVMLRFGVQIEVWSSKPPLIPYGTDITVHRGDLQEAIDAFEPHIIHTHWTHFVQHLRDKAAENGIPLTVRGHHPYDFGAAFAEAFEKDPIIAGVYIYKRFAEKLAFGAKVLPVNACFDPEQYFPQAEKDNRLVVRTAPARMVKDLEFFFQVAARCPEHRFVLCAGTTSEIACPEQLKVLNKKYGNCVDLRIDAPHAEAADLVRRAGIFLYTVSPTQKYSMPIAVSEALGAECYVLSREMEGAREHIGDSGALYKDEDQAVALIKETLGWSAEQWAAARSSAASRAEDLAGPKVLRPLLDDWIRIASLHSGFEFSGCDGVNLVAERRAKNRQLVIVLGMHRSGTSAITRGLAVVGVNLGERLISALPENNAKGFWEDVDINAMNDQMLKSVGMDWCSLAPIEEGHIETLRRKGFFVGAVGLLEKKLEAYPNFGFKDPRVAKLWPFWQEVIERCGLSIKVILALRHPFSVAESLVKRDKLDRTISYLLWLEHVILGLSATQDPLIVDYDNVMDSPTTELKRIASYLGSIVDPHDMEAYAGTFLDDELRHTTFNEEDLVNDPLCPDLVREIYSVLRESAKDTSNAGCPKFKERTAAWCKEWERLKPSLSLHERQSAEMRRMAKAMDQLVELGECLAQRDQAIAEFKGSTSWRVTKPLRSVKQVLSRIKR